MYERGSSQRAVRWRASASLLVLLSSLPFTALGQGNQSGPVLSGTLDTPAGTTGSATAYAIYLSGARFKAVARGPLQGTGEFTITLPGTVDEALLNPVDFITLCQGGDDGITGRYADVPHAMVMFVMWLGEETGAGAVMASSCEVFDRLAEEPQVLEPGDFAIFHLYSAAPLRVTGNCASLEGATLVLDIDAPPGWSLIRYGYASDSSAAPGGIAVDSIPAVPEGARWRTFVDGG